MVDDEQTPSVWSEPLTADSEDQNAHTFATTLRDATGRPLAGVVCAVNREARTLWVGDMLIGDQTGTLRQRIRGLVLMARELFAHAADLGLVHARTVAPAAIAPLARRVSGLAGDTNADGTVTFTGTLVDVRTRTLENTDATGELVSR